MTLIREILVAHENKKHKEERIIKHTLKGEKWKKP